MSNDIKDVNEALARGHDILRTADDTWGRLKQPSWRDHAFLASELQRKDHPPIRYIIPGVVPEGLSMLAGRPKLGKSWLALELAAAVAGGTPCLGEIVPEQGDVLYCALEDNERRLKNRMTKLLGPNLPWPHCLTLTTKWERLDKGGVRDIKDWIESSQSPRLVILDTLASVRQVTNKEGYAADYQALTAIHRLANDRGIAILVLHHQRKGEAEDPIDTISGTLGIAGCVDTPIILSRKTAGASLYVRGRDVEETEHAVQFDKALCRWRIVGDADELHRSDTRRKILATLKEAAGSLGPSVIADRAGLSEPVVRNRLSAMVQAGEVTKVGRGEYIHPDCETSLRP
ncbi:AAA family ATPase [Hyphomicrobium sp.]|uniref:AAA family ATPase n=1 Tax=Hyphomicrobium sp. TaxID=82 RepID=UPI000FB0121A|nr:AAA family ATPase [Hyphomicrobium sp.]RUO97991.1 MAG: winged helix-turn-helix transcriptional regulator [Hyphomicrobium sp.]